MKISKTFKQNLISFPLGSFYVLYKETKYLVTKQQYSQNKIIKLYAQELCGTNIISGNFFTTIQDGLLKPCEMEPEKVIDFVENCKIIHQ